MSRVRYTVVAVLREEALCQPDENVFRITVRVGAPGAPTGTVLMAQPLERPSPAMAGSTIELDARLVTMDGTP